MDIKDGLELIKKYEGCRLSAYLCPAGVPTIGYGHTKGVKLGQTITQEKAEKLLEEDIKVFCKKVDKYDKIYKFNQNEYNALLSFCFNIGSLDQLTAKGTRSKEVIGEKMKLYVKANGRTLSGLVRRRNEESALYKKGVV